MVGKAILRPCCEDHVVKQCDVKRFASIAKGLSQSSVLTARSCVARRVIVRYDAPYTVAQ